MRQGRSTFTNDEIEQIRRLVREKQTADRDRQKAIRARLRSIGFRISDFADYSGFVESDLDQLIVRGTLTVVSARAADEEPGPPRVAPLRTIDHSRGSPGRLAVDEVEAADYVRQALRALARKAPLDQAAKQVPARPGLYAIYGDVHVWQELGLSDPPDERPLYVGKAEKSLVSRDLDTHFGNGRTGSSTVRRSFAALLREALALEGRPRNPAKPERFANYGLSPEHDETLTNWMRKHLELAVWSKPDECEFGLAVIEGELLRKLEPPLNLAGVITSWTPQVKAARTVMADQARKFADGS